MPAVPRPRASPPWVALMLAVSCVLAVLAAGCAPQRTPDLLEVEAVESAVVTPGDQLVLLGAGFPARSSVEVALSGALARPDERMRRIQLSEVGFAESRSRIVLPRTSALADRLLESARHGTFRGQVTVRHRSRQEGAPTISGTLDVVTLDIFREVEPREEARLLAEARRFADYLGVELDEGLVVARLSKGVAERAGLRVGDQLTELDGLRLDAWSDFIPSRERKPSLITVRRAESATPLEFVVDRSDFRPLGPKDLGVAWGVVGTILLMLVAWSGRLGRLLSFVETKLSAIRPAKSSAIGRYLSLGHRALSPSELPRPLRPAPYLVVFAVQSGLGWLALGHHMVGPDMDLFGLLLGASAALVLSGFLLEGRTREQFRLWVGLQGALRAMSAAVPALSAVVTVVLHTGSLQLSEMVSSQGSSPIGWNAVRSPWHWFALLLLLASLVPRAGHRGTERRLSGRASLASGFVRLVESAAVVALCGLAAILFLGGWAGGSALEGVGLLLVKTWALHSVVLWWQGALDGLRRDELGPSFWATLASSAFGSTLVAFLVSRFDLSAEVWADLTLGTALLSGAMVLLAVGFLFVVSRRKVQTATLNPWL